MASNRMIMWSANCLITEMWYRTKRLRFVSVASLISRSNRPDRVESTAGPKATLGDLWCLATNSGDATTAVAKAPYGTQAMVLQQWDHVRTKPMHAMRYVIRHVRLLHLRELKSLRTWRCVTDAWP